MCSSDLLELLHYTSPTDFSATALVEDALSQGAEAVVISDFHAALLVEHFGDLPFGLVGYNGSVFMDASRARITHVDSNLREMGRQAMALLESNLDDQDILIEPILRIGDTPPPLYP